MLGMRPLSGQGLPSLFKKLSVALSVGLLLGALATSHAEARTHSSSKRTASKQVVAKKTLKKDVKASLKAKKNLAPARAKAASSFAPVRLSHGQLMGLHKTSDPLSLQSGAVMVIDEESQEILLKKNEGARLPIASLTKLMTGLIITEAKLPMGDRITITEADVDREKFSGSRLAVGRTFTRGELMTMSLMSSENRAAHALGRTYPGGLPAFVQAMNAKARELGMKDSAFVEPTGLSSNNRSSARDLIKLVQASSDSPALRYHSTLEGKEFGHGRGSLQYRTTNALIRNPAWDIDLQKTGYISEAGHCLLMQAQIAGRKVVMVFLDSTSKMARFTDAERVRRWIERQASSDRGGRSAQQDHTEKDPMQDLLDRIS